MVKIGILNSFPVKIKKKLDSQEWAQRLGLESGRTVLSKYPFNKRAEAFKHKDSFKTVDCQTIHLQTTVTIV